jgi:hypothetical protein
MSELPMYEPIEDSNDNFRLECIKCTFAILVIVGFAVVFYLF